VKRHPILFAGIILLVICTSAPAQFGGLAPPAPISLRVIEADAIVVGKLVKAEGKKVPATLFKGAKAKVEYQVLELKVEDGLRGAKKGDTLRLGSFALKPMGRRPGVPDDAGLRVGQECLFFLSRHHDEPFFVTGQDNVSVEKAAAEYAKALQLARRCVKLWGDTKAGLKSKDAQDRFLTADMLIQRYRLFRPGKFGPDTEPIPADESKLILTALADADWKAEPGGSILSHQARLFFLLEVTAKDGWTPTASGAGLNEAARQWVKKHAGTYRIQRFAPVPKGKKE
jgi:hypothetical protein